MCIMSAPQPQQAQMPQLPDPPPTPVDQSVQAARRASSMSMIASAMNSSGVATSPLGLPNIAKTTANFKNFLGG